MYRSNARDAALCVMNFLVRRI
ncbi:hypothetical protein Rmet_6456 [Cupriavidus metallidurans CH34]|uniref:Uncharacterized protein n=1 Tax=Cupriavidus metallidurans (strain ATCC 43123 / DSM 2839 / NBRC 102507 / CH34) TaxID=266264 RepID=D3DXQ1_CUPMC|nr:hypothetical protein Rmet_6456 [Cupriavidus metallidurans CH34]